MRNDGARTTRRKLAEIFVAAQAPDAANRAANDFYRTPEAGTRRLLAKERFPGTVWEPACGDGAMSRVLQEVGSKVISSDVADYGFRCRRIDFLTDRPAFKFDHIVTNPPFTHTLEFVQRALSYRPRKVAMLARLAWLEAKSRREFFEASGLSRVWVYAGRINVVRNGDDYGGKPGMVAYAWYVWERGHEGPPSLGWI